MVIDFDFSTDHLTTTLPLDSSKDIFGVASYGDYWFSSVRYYFDERASDIHLAPSLQSLSVTEEAGQISWTMDGTQPGFIASVVEQTYSENNEDVGVVIWELLQKGDHSDISIPVLPEVLTEGLENAESEIGFVRVTAIHSEKIQTMSGFLDYAENGVHSKQIPLQIDKRTEFLNFEF